MKNATAHYVVFTILPLIGIAVVYPILPMSVQLTLSAMSLPLILAYFMLVDTKLVQVESINVKRALIAITTSLVLAINSLGHIVFADENKNPYKYIPDVYYDFSIGFNAQLAESFNATTAVNRLKAYANDPESASYEVGKVSETILQSSIMAVGGAAGSKLATLQQTKALIKANKQNAMTNWIMNRK